MSEDPRVIAAYVDERVCCRAGGEPSTLRAVSRDLVAAIRSVGVEGRSVLDVGCGVGGLSLALLDAGAGTAIGVDLSRQAVDQARRTAERQGTGDRSVFRVADGSTAEFDEADVVVLDKVYCCYFDPEALLANTLPVAREVYAMVLPPSRGVRGLVARLAIGAENLGRRLTGTPFRAYVHDVDTLDAAIRRGGFRPAAGRRRPVWDVRVYVRDRHSTA